MKTCARFLACAVAAALVRTAVAADDASRWELFPFYGGGYVMNVVFTRNPLVAYMTVDVGGPYRTDDACRSWRPLHGNMPFAMRRQRLDHARSLSVDPRDENNIVCASGNGPDPMGGIVVSRDGGRTWRQTAVGNYLSNGRRRWMGQLLSRDPWNPDVLVTGGDCTGLMKSADNGETWRSVGLDGHWFSHVHHDRGVKGRVWACAPGYEDVPEEARMVAAGRDPNPKPRYGRARGLYRSDDGGETWCRLDVARVPEELCQIDGDPRIVGLFDEQYLMSSRDGGVTWEDFSQGLERLPHGRKIGDDSGCQSGRYTAIGAGPDFLLVCNTRGGVLRRGREDASWTKVTSNPVVYTEPDREMRPYRHMPAACSIVVNPHDARQWFVTDWYAVWMSPDEGRNWYSRIHGAQQLVPFTVAASPFNPDVVFAATADSPMYMSWDGIRSFKKMAGPAGIAESVNSVAFSRVTPGLVLVTGGKFRTCVRVSRDDGRTWSLASTNGLPKIRPDLGWTKNDGFYAPYSVAVHPTRDDFLLAMGGVAGRGKGGVYRTRDAGETWEWFGEGLPQGEHLFKFMEWGNGAALAVSESGDMLCWDMAGEKVFRRGLDDVRWSRVGFSMKVTDPASGRGMGCAISALPGRPGWFVANCGAGRAALHRSTDGGRTFRPLPGVSGRLSPIACDSHRPGMFVVGGEGALFLTRDFGDHFVVIPGGYDWPSGAEPEFVLDRGRIWAMGSGSGFWSCRDVIR